MRILTTNIIATAMAASERQALELENVAYHRHKSNQCIYYFLYHSKMFAWAAGPPTYFK